MKVNNGPLPKVVLHVGRHKTGTTSIQKFLALNEDSFAAQYGILYPAIGRDPHLHYHHPLFRQLVENSRPVDKEKINEMVREAKARKCHTILLSSEILSRPGLSEDQLNNIREAFTGHEMKIVLYFRRQDAFIESNYSERVKRGLLAAPKTISDIEQNSLDYYQFAERYKVIFGKENLIIRSYDLDKTPGLYFSFLSILDIPFSDSFVMPRNSLNRRYSWRYIELIRQFNRWKLGRRLGVNRHIRVFAERLSTWFPEVMDSPKPLSQKSRREILAMYKSSNERLAREYLNRESLF